MSVTDREVIPSGFRSMGRRTIDYRAPEYPGHSLSRVPEFERLMFVNRLPIRDKDCAIEDIFLGLDTDTAQLYEEFGARGCIPLPLIDLLARTETRREFGYLFLRVDAVVSVTRRLGKTGIFVHSRTQSAGWCAGYHLFLPAS